MLHELCEEKNHWNPDLITNGCPTWSRSHGRRQSHRPDDFFQTDSNSSRQSSTSGSVSYPGDQQNTSTSCCRLTDHGDHDSRLLYNCSICDVDDDNDGGAPWEHPDEDQEQPCLPRRAVHIHQLAGLVSPCPPCPPPWPPPQSFYLQVNYIATCPFHLLYSLHSVHGRWHQIPKKAVWRRGEEEEVFKLGLCATLLAPSSIDAWRAIWGVSWSGELSLWGDWGGPTTEVEAWAQVTIDRSTAGRTRFSLHTHMLARGSRHHFWWFLVSNQFLLLFAACYIKPHPWMWAIQVLTAAGWLLPGFGL